MASKTKQVVLVIVDGPTDETALRPVFKKLFQNTELKFHVIHGDVTSERMLSSANAVKAIKEHIEFEISRYGYKRDDVIRVIHLIDTDGAFIPDSHVLAGETGRPCYEEDAIIAGNPQSIIERNERKASILRKLFSSSAIWSIPYSVYYFSRNMEHVLHGAERNLTDDEKIEFADEFADAYADAPDAFINFLTDSDFTVQGGYRDTWAFICDGTNSLHRFCNLHLLFSEPDTD